MLPFILIASLLSLLFFSLHLGGRHHRSRYLTLGSMMLILALVFVPFYINTHVTDREAALSLPDIIEFYGTVLGLFSSCVLGYVAFRISRNDHKRHNSCCITVSSVKCRPIYVPDYTFFETHTSPQHRAARKNDWELALAALRSATPPKEEPDYIPKQPPSARSQNGLFNYNVQRFPDTQNPDKTLELGKLSNEAEVLLSRAALRKRRRLTERVEKMKRIPHPCGITRARLVLTERRLQRYQDYTVLPDSAKRNVLAFRLYNQGSTALQQIVLTFPRNNYRFSCYVSLTEKEEKCKFITLPDDCRQDDVICITFISCYNEHTYGEFKLNSLPHAAPWPLNEENADAEHVARNKTCIHYSTKHYHYYGSQKQ